MRLEIGPIATTIPLTENRVLEQTGDASSPVFELLLKHGIAAAQEGDRDRAREFLNQAADVNPKSEDAWMWLASISDYPEELLAFLNNALEINPENEKAIEWRTATKSLLAKTMAKRAVLAHEENDGELAEQCIQQALYLDDRCEQALLLKATLSEREDQKVDFYDKAPEIESENQEASHAAASITKAEFSEAKAAAAAGDQAKAVEILDAFLKDSPDSVEGWALKSHLSVSLAEKVEALENALEIDPENAAARSGLAFLVLTFGSSTETSNAKSFELKDSPVELAGELEIAAPAVTNEPASEFKNQVNGSAEFYESTVDFSDDLDVTVSPDFHVPFETTRFLTEQTASSEFSESESAVKSAEAAEVPEALAFSKQPTAEMIVIEQTPVEEEAKLSFDSQLFKEKNESAGNENNPWKSKVDTIDSWLTQEASQENVNIANVNIDADVETSPNRDVDDLFEPIPETNNAEQKTVETLFPLVPEADSFAETSVKPENEPIADKEQSNSNKCSFCYAINTTEAVNCIACMAPLAVTINESQSYAESVETINAELVEEVAAEINQTGTACHFCSSQNDTQAFECSNCHAILTLSDIESLLTNPRANHELIQQSVTKMEAEWNLREFDEQELAALAVGHFNLGNSASGFSYLQEAARANPNDVILAGQVNAIAIRLDEMRRHDEVYDAMPKGRTILVVDDSPTVRKLISGKLEKSGHNVVCAVDGVDALARLDESLPDLILLDIAMPRMDGYEVCKQIRSNPAAKDLPVVMISGKDGFFDKVRGRMAGCTGYVTKPFGPETLMKALETYLLPVEVEAN